MSPSRDDEDVLGLACIFIKAPCLVHRDEFVLIAVDD
jgi:hypothetical protein